MRKYNKGYKPVFKDLTNEDAYNELSKEYPIKVKYQEDLIDRIQSKYPYISKVEIATIVKTALNGMRFFMFIGKNLHFKKISNIFRLIYTYRIYPVYGIYGYVYGRIDILFRMFSRTKPLSNERK